MSLIIVFLVVFCITFYFYRSKNVSYWSKKGIPTAPGCNWFFGNYKPILFTEKHISTLYTDMYRLYPEAPVVGFVKMSTPGLLIRDPDLIKAVLSTDFNSFGKNEFKIDKKVDKLFGYHPFVLSGEEWKTSRAHSTPSLSYSKLKNYYPVLLHVGDELIKYLNKECQETSGSGGVIELETKDLGSMFTTDTISNAIYGIENNTFLDRNSLFAQLAKEVFSGNFFDNMRTMVNALFPEICSIIGVRFASKRSEAVLLSLTKKMMKEREESTGETRNDIFQQMLTFRQNGKADIFTDEYIASHLYAYLLDGYETSSILICYALYELAWHIEVQDKLRAEVQGMISRTNGDYTAEDVEGLKYLNMVVCETLRLNVPLPVMSKECTSDYTVSDLPGLDKPLEIKNGTFIIIPVDGLHTDEKYFPSPLKFDPERFTDDEVAKRHKFVYLPFGEGPRKCLGQRFGLLQSKIAIIKIVANFHITPSAKSKYPTKVDPAVFLLRRPEGGAWVNMTPFK
ncbi:cytochrome P450 6j1 [Plutella xylostella]|uniref:cytochrome P450 6j1 n=1 Tax=Plutella xylostella TaxID=51655 RepID=UPI00203318F3|nr:cytochrome P450 6j1 [Plutella xylostella]